MYSTTNIWEPLRKYRVDFLHRSVKDYLETSDMQRFLHEHAGSDFNVERTLASLFVAQAKVMNVQDGLDDEMQAYKYMADEAKYFATMHDLAVADRSCAFNRRITEQLETVEIQMRLQSNTVRLPGLLEVPQSSAKSRSRSRSSSRENGRFQLSGMLHGIFDKRKDQ